MKKAYAIDGCPPVMVQFDVGIIRVFNEGALHCLMKKETEKKTLLLVQKIKADYEYFYHQPLHISNYSIIVEIWAHVYAERLLHVIARFLHWKILWKFYDFVKGRCDIIDCGERKIDKNRWIWDVFSRMRKLIFSVFKKLPGHRSISVSAVIKSDK